jgi:hypothetical protein
MDNKAKIERAKAIQEELARVQAQHAKLVKLEEAASPMNLSTLLENDLEQAELILAAQDVMTRLQEMAEDLAKTSARDLFPLADRMKAAFGPEAAKAFEQASTGALNMAMETVRAAKDQLGTAILKIEGKIPGSDMAADAGMDAGGTIADPAAANPIAQPNMAADNFAGADAASGPAEEPLGRGLKDSIEAKAPALTENIDYRAAGRKLIESEGMESLMDWLLTEAAAQMSPSEFTQFAKKVSVRAAKDPEATAGWIGKKRYGAAAMAQLTAPTMTASSDDLNESADLEERARFDDEDGDDGRDGKRASKGRDVALDKARMRKQMAEGIAKVIEGNIAKEGKGMAAAVVESFVGKFSGLMEGIGEVLDVAAVNSMFEEAFGMKPAAYSVAKLKEFMANTDQKQAGSALAAVASTIAKDKNAVNKPLSSAMSGLDSQERSAVNKEVQKLKQNGENPQKLGDLVSAAAGDDDDVQEQAAKPVSRFARKPQA